MKLRNALAATAGVVTGVAAANWYLASAAREYEAPLTGEEGTYRWRGMDIGYVEAGDPEDQDVLLLHGIHAAASNKEFDQVFDQLSKSHHVVAPDLPGFGASDRPPLVYSASLYESFVLDVARDLTEDAVCVATSLTASYAASVQAEHAPFSRLELICPTDETSPRRPWLRSLLRSPVIGTGLFNVLASKPSLRRFTKRDSFYSEASFTEHDIDDYWRTAHRPGARFAPASFVSGYLDPQTSLETALSDVDVPVTLIWGRDVNVTPVTRGRELAEAVDAKLVVIEEARLLPHAEHPGPFLEVILDEEIEEREQEHGSETGSETDSE